MTGKDVKPGQELWIADTFQLWAPEQGLVPPGSIGWLPVYGSREAAEAAGGEVRLMGRVDDRPGLSDE